MPQLHPYKEKLIEELKQDDEYICIAGYPAVINENSLVLDDGKATINVLFNDSINKDAKFIKVFGRALSVDGIISIQADFIQDLSKIDTFLYNKVRLLLKK